MTRPIYDFADEQPSGLMADLEACARPVRRLPNLRALAVLDQMFAYHDMEEPVGRFSSAYDSAA